MAVTAKSYGNFIKATLSKEIDWLNDTIKVMLLSEEYTPDQDAHDYKDDVADYEITGVNYTAGGVTLQNKTYNYNAQTNTATLDADDPVWSASTISARYAVVYDDTPETDETKPLIGYIDFGQVESSSNGNFVIAWNSSGIINMIVA